MDRSNEEALHIVSFDVPYPADYGGITDVFFKVRALREIGLRVFLHCFQHDRPTPKALEAHADAVYYYPRRFQKHLLLHKSPFIVTSRKSDKLVENLAGDDHPVLFEGLHTCYSLRDPRLSHKPRFVRLHNIEHQYYRELSKAERGIFKKNFMKLEGRKLKHFEGILSSADGLFPICPKDRDYYAEKFRTVDHIPPFHDNEEVDLPEATEEFALYHGNLAVGENDRAARFLVEEVMPRSRQKLIIAGNNPTSGLREKASKSENVVLLQDIPKERIHQMIHKARVNILPTFQSTGIKLKLLNALFRGNHCLVNTPMIKQTGLEELCICRDDPSEMGEALDRLMQRSLTKEEKEHRKTLLERNFSNRANATKLRESLAPIRQPLSLHI